MEALAFIIGLSGPLQQSIDVIQDLQHRIAAWQSHETDAGKLLRRYIAIQTGLTDLSRDHQASLSRLPEHVRQNISTSLSEIRALLESSAKQIECLQKELRSPFTRIRRANRTEEFFKIRISETGEVDQKVLTLSCMLNTIAAQAPSSSEADRYFPSNTAPINPGSLAFDFASMDASGVPCTCEGRLKAEVLGTATTVGAVASGGGGVGKTCALLAIAQEKDVWERFPGGVYFMRLGHDATVGTVIEQLALSVCASGGLQLSRKIREEDKLSMVIAQCKGWFAQQVCLFMFDDLWQSNDIGDDILRTISELISSVHGNQGSRIVYSTRETELAQQGSQVSFSPRTSFGGVSRKMLLQAAGVDAKSSEVSYCDAAITRVLEKCAGLPVALSLAGRNIGILRKDWGEDQADNAWLEYANALEEEEGKLVSERMDGYPSLRSAIVVSLAYLDKHRDRVSSCHGDLSFREMHRALCVLQRQQWIPVGALTVLWGLEDEKTTLPILKRMVRVGLADSESRNSGNGFMFGLRLHDLVHEVVTFEAEEAAETHAWHTRIVKGFRVNLGPTSQSPDWPIKLPNDGFAVENICRLMVGGGDAASARQLLFGPRWIVKMLEMGRILQLETDVQMYLKHIEVGDISNGSGSGTTTVMPANDTDALTMLCKICRLCQSFCFQKEALAWFQLYARLQATCNGPGDEWMACMMREIEEFVPKPWVKPLGVCMTSARSPLLQVLPGSFLPDSVQMLSDGSVASCGYSGEMFFSNHFGRNAEIVSRTGEISDMGDDEHPFGKRRSSSSNVEGNSTTERRKLRMWGKSAFSFSKEKQQSAIREKNRTLAKWKTSLTTFSEYLTNIGHGKNVSNISDGSDNLSPDEREFTCMAISADGHWAATGGEDNAVRVWDITTGAQVGKGLAGHAGTISCVAIGSDGRRGVSGGMDGTVRMWDVTNGAQVGEESAAHTGTVLSVAINADGSRALSGGMDGTVRMWDVTSGVRVGDAFAGHSRGVWCVAVSADGRLAVSGGDDEAVLVWDVTTGMQVGKALTMHSGTVSSVAISSDGRRAVSGGDDETVRVWDVINSAQIGEALAGHYGGVTCVAITADGCRVVSGGYDKVVRVWDVTTGAQVGTRFAGYSECVKSGPGSVDGRWTESGAIAATVCVPNVTTGPQMAVTSLGHSGTVIRVAISASGRWAISGGMDGSVCVWDVTNGVQVGEALAGHSGGVTSVAISADGQRAFSGGVDETVRVWDVRRGAQVGEALAGHSGLVLSVAGSADGRRAVSGGMDGTVRVWDATTGAELGEALSGHCGRVTGVAISWDGQRAVSGGMDGTVCVWDVRRGLQVGEALGGCPRGFTSVAISADGRRAVSGDIEKTVRVWDIDSGVSLSVDRISNAEGQQTTAAAIRSRVAMKIAEEEGCPLPAEGFDIPSLSKLVVFDCEPIVVSVHGSLAVVGLPNGKVHFLRWVNHDSCDSQFDRESEDKAEGVGIRRCFPTGTHRIHVL